MAFNTQTFKTRTLSAIVFVVIFISLFLHSSYSFFALFLIIQIGCWIEFNNLFCLIDKAYKSYSAFYKYGLMLTGCLMMGYATSNAFNIKPLNISLSEICWWLVFVGLLIMPLIEILFVQEVSIKKIKYALLGLCYIVMPITLLVHLRLDASGSSFNNVTIANYSLNIIVPALIIISVWINDTMAYIVGSFIGKTPFFPTISPKKTWEGTIGGIIMSGGVVYIIAYYYLPTMLTPFVCITLISAVIGTIGDLFESKLKRIAGVKDSGTIMPGHGGFLDRFDSLLFAIPFVYLFVKIYF